MITLHKNLRTPLAALLPLDVWEVNIHTARNFTLVLSEFTLDVEVVHGLVTDVLGSEHGIMFSINLDDSWESDGTHHHGAFLQFLIHWSKTQPMAVHTDCYEVTTSGQAQKLVSAAQDVINALLESQMPLDEGVALDWYCFTDAGIERVASGYRQQHAD